jgi:alpha-ribazole phosphatase
MWLWLLRHARPLVEEGVCYGALDLAADAAETVAAARQAAQVLPPGVQVLSSPLRRCMQLAQALAALRPDLAPREDARLAEMDFGSWEGRRWDSIARVELEAWTSDFQGYRAGGQGESVSQFMARVGGALEGCRTAGRDQAWITHGGVFKALLLPPGGLAPPAASEWPRQELACGSWHRFEIDAG